MVSDVVAGITKLIQGEKAREAQLVAGGCIRARYGKHGKLRNSNKDLTSAMKSGANHSQILFA